MTYLVGAKGQIVIAKEIRERLGIQPGWVALQRLVGDRVEIYFLPPEHRESLKGSLAPYLKAGVPPGEAWDKARIAAWEAATREADAQESRS
ncbi:MAG TPA: AbrB/MazE/SpoVT family DNA-binding domain-containing protein [Anaerolineales bacterium]|jgi:AbrB family looped-hinge helix DNA binding protein|nr:AbrB/MazE/SpoVT family DNA-binding domain-containing protein [Anaerolineales bacterium]